MSGKVTVKTAAGEVSRKVVVPKGEPDNFLTDQELAAKFHGLVDRVMGAERAAALAEAVLGLATARDVAGLMRLASPLPAMRLAGE
jgi:2-methylcitrate dehydratase PrpD